MLFILEGMSCIYFIVVSFIVGLGLAIVLTIAPVRKSEKAFKKISIFAIICVICSSFSYLTGMVLFFFQFTDAVALSYPLVCDFNNY